MTGTEIVDWLIRQNIQQNRAQACLIGQKLLYGEWIKSVSDDIKVNSLDNLSLNRYLFVAFVGIDLCLWDGHLSIIKSHSLALKL